MKYKETLSTKYKLRENITKLHSIAQGVFNNTTSQMVLDEQDAERAKHQRKSFQRLHDHREKSSKIGSWKLQNNSVNKNPDFMPQVS